MLIPGGQYDGGVFLLLEHVDIHLALFLGLLLVLEVDVWSVDVKVGWEDRLCPIDEEEGGVPHRTVHACP